jgi:hypothetical protein
MTLYLELGYVMSGINCQALPNHKTIIPSFQNSVIGTALSSKRISIPPRKIITHAKQLTQANAGTLYLITPLQTTCFKVIKMIH